MKEGRLSSGFCLPTWPFDIFLGLLYRQNGSSDSIVLLGQLSLPQWKFYNEWPFSYEKWKPKTLSCTQALVCFSGATFSRHTCVYLSHLHIIALPSSKNRKPNATWTLGREIRQGEQTSPGEVCLTPGHTWCPRLSRGGVTLFTRESGCCSLAPYALSGLWNLI